RAQIARTTIEEAFVNNTKNTHEGDHRFPLPADASITAFAMWIGDELVEADIVEKQRARAIYEQILREKRDPGLLEWSGGNLFKARVFPIFPHSQKRIRIRYTQVLPLEGRTIRYSYPLRSEMLAKTPLKELVVDAKIWSTTKISKVESPTHAMQTSSDGETASARFEAQDYAPSGDFELRTELAEVPPLRVVAHQRGTDGYFMALLNAPRSDGGTLDTTPEGKAIEVVVVADVSGSMARATRIGQHRFVEGLLNLLGPNDRFRIVTADADVRAYQETASEAKPTAITEAMTWLDSRISLGWTDLDATFEAIARLDATPSEGRDRVVVYVGDGIHTAGDGDSAALAARLQARYARTKASFHAVAASSSYETAVLESIAQLGSGTMRVLDESDPSGTAVALLREARSPAIEELEIRFEGLQTARVYPATSKRLPEGMQHTILGRYLPSATIRSVRVSGRVIVTGKQDGKPLRFEQAVTLAADKGQSFVPRLWARRHIDQLLAEGGEQSKANVVALSSEFGIMTPYTSFLVLENDEDRERFGVERSMHMRDGEDFFAAARDRATETLLREQLAKARGWRLELQRHMYRELSGLGRDLHVALAEQVGSHDVSIVDALGASQLSKDEWANSIVTETRGSRSQLGRMRLAAAIPFDSAEMAPTSPAHEVEEGRTAVSGTRDVALGLD
ncbi:MAG TPA: VIT domain-containing protein, partial [Planctomycetota bacterium]|nr:VIT domain-containing protein [Planctomycetota bacterium]